MSAPTSTQPPTQPRRLPALHTATRRIRPSLAAPRRITLGNVIDRIDVPAPVGVVEIITAPAPVMRAASPLTAPLPAGPLTAADLATGRGLTYEWEYFVAELFNRIDAGAGGDPSQAEVFQQLAPAATWTITHGLNTKPVVVVITPDGQQLMPELHYPSNTTVVVVHGQPYAGTAFLRA